MLEGRIIKGIGGFYYVRTDLGLIECRPRGIFRKKDITPMVGDNVKISFVKGSEVQGVIEEILPRETVMLRPMAANVRQCVIVISVSHPEPDLLFLDRLLVITEISGLEPAICFNKIDLSAKGDYREVTDRYADIGYNVICTSAKTGEGINGLKEILRDKVSVFSGLSGVGKSSLLNSLEPSLKLKTGDISRRTGHGRHVTRHAEMLELTFGGMVVDAPGFSSLKLGFLEPCTIDEKELCYYFPEFKVYMQLCRFSGCRHLKEPGCGVKTAMGDGKIAPWRYQNYVALLGELQEGGGKYD